MTLPITPGDFVGQARDGYFWNGTSWNQGETTPGSAVPPSTMSLNSGAPTAPNTAFGGAIINQQNAAPAAPPSAPAPPASSAKRPSILGTIMQIESGGKNVPQQIDDINMRNGDPAQGFYQITGGTWNEFGGGKTGSKSALDAPYATQLQIAQNIPVQRWGPATQQALRAAGYDFKPGETLGQMLTRYGEDPNATRPEDVGGSSAGGTAQAAAGPQPWAPPASLLAPPTTAASASAAAGAASAEQKQQAAAAAMTKQGMGLLGEATTPGVGFIQAPAVHRPQVQPLPDFNQVLAQQRLKQGQGV